jgi:hypothetical protein
MSTKLLYWNICIKCVKLQDVSINNTKIETIVALHLENCLNVSLLVQSGSGLDQIVSLGKFLSCTR